jgi:hypothetical protein
MRKFVLILAAAVCLTAGSAITKDTASAQSATVTIGTGDRDNWRDARSYRRGDSRTYRSNRYQRSDRRYRASRSYARNCRIVTTRTRLASGRVIIRKMERCYR